MYSKRHPINLKEHLITDRRGSHRLDFLVYLLRYEIRDLDFSTLRRTKPHPPRWVPVLMVSVPRPPGRTSDQWCVPYRHPCLRRPRPSPETFLLSLGTVHPLRVSHSGRGRRKSTTSPVLDRPLLEPRVGSKRWVATSHTIRVLLEQ